MFYKKIGSLEFSFSFFEVKIYIYIYKVVKIGILRMIVESKWKFKNTLTNIFKFWPNVTKKFNKYLISNQIPKYLSKRTFGKYYSSSKFQIWNPKYVSKWKLVNYNMKSKTKMNIKAKWTFSYFHSKVLITTVLNS